MRSSACEARPFLSISDALFLMAFWRATKVLYASEHAFKNVSASCGTNTIREGGKEVCDTTT